MTDNMQIKTRADGSIDTAHYMARGRKLRSRAAHDLAGAARRRPARLAAAWLAALALRTVGRSAASA